MGMLVGQLIKILEQFDQDREVMIHTLSGETVEVRGYFVQKDIDDNSFYITDLDVVDKKKARREAKKHIENELQDQL